MSDDSATPQENPFSTRFVRPGALDFAFSAGETPTQLVESFLTGERRAQIVGPHGSGKSTLVAALMREFAAFGVNVTLIELHDGERRLPSVELPGLRSVVIVDGYEQLGFFARRKLQALACAADAGLIVTTHRSCGLPTLYETRPSPELATSLAAKLTEKAQPPDADVVRELYRSERGNLREIFFRLYDLYESRRS